MALIGYTNKLVSDIKSLFLQDEIMCKLLYYNNEDGDILELPPVKNPVKELKDKIFLNRRLEVLQKDADVGMTINLYSKQNWRREGKKSDASLKNIVEIGIVVHNDCDDTLNGSRMNALIELTIKKLLYSNIDGLGDFHFENMFMMKDLSIEYTGYLLYFNIFNLSEEGLC